MRHNCVSWTATRVCRDSIGRRWLLPSVKMSSHSLHPRCALYNAALLSILQLLSFLYRVGLNILLDSRHACRICFDSSIEVYIFSFIENAMWAKHLVSIALVSRVSTLRLSVLPLPTKSLNASSYLECRVTISWIAVSSACILRRCRIVWSTLHLNNVLFLYFEILPILPECIV